MLIQPNLPKTFSPVCKDCANYFHFHKMKKII